MKLISCHFLRSHSKFCTSKGTVFLFLLHNIFGNRGQPTGRKENGKNKNGTRKFSKSHRISKFASSYKKNILWQARRFYYNLQYYSQLLKYLKITTQNNFSSSVYWSVNNLFSISFQNNLLQLRPRFDSWGHGYPPLRPEQGPLAHWQLEHLRQRLLSCRCRNNHHQRQPKSEKKKLERYCSELTI